MDARREAGALVLTAVFFELDDEPTPVRNFVARDGGAELLVEPADQLATDYGRIRFAPRALIQGAA